MRFSLRALFFGVTVSIISMAAVWSSNLFIASVLLLSLVTFVCMAMVTAIVGPARERSFWTGVAIFAIGYLLFAGRPDYFLMARLPSLITQEFLILSGGVEDALYHGAGEFDVEFTRMVIEIDFVFLFSIAGGVFGHYAERGRKSSS